MVLCSTGRHGRTSLLIKAIVASLCGTSSAIDWGMHSVPILAAVHMRGEEFQSDTFGALRTFERKEADKPREELLTQLNICRTKLGLKVRTFPGKTVAELQKKVQSCKQRLPKLVGTSLSKVHARSQPQ